MAPPLLQIFRLDFASTDHDLKLAGGAVQAPERFSRVCWGLPGVDAKAYPVGVQQGQGRRVARASSGAVAAALAASLSGSQPGSVAGRLHAGVLSTTHLPTRSACSMA